MLDNSGIVVKSTGSWYLVRTPSGMIHKARMKGKFRLKGFKLTNPVGVGDQVLWDKEVDSDNLIIKEILPRRNYVVRQSPRKQHYLHLLAANIDEAILIVTIVHPMLKQGFIDRFLMMTEPHDIPVTIVFNKSDLYEESELNMYKYLKELYEKIGYKVQLMSVKNEVGINELRASIQDKTVLISGQSGVGKSTLINALLGEERLVTDELSESSGKGQHTTTFAEMFELDEHSHIIDTPGIKSLSFNNYEIMDIAHNFRELFNKSVDCKFSNCTHRDEPKCAVRDAVEEQDISELRYLNYLQLIEEVEDQNYWERLDM